MIIQDLDELFYYSIEYNKEEIYSSLALIESISNHTSSGKTRKRIIEILHNVWHTRFVSCRWGEFLDEVLVSSNQALP